MKLKEIRKALENKDLKNEFKSVYIEDTQVARQQERYLRIINNYCELFGETDSDAMLFSAPGRTEVCGNHTDHNNGKVLAAAINLDAIAVAVKTGDNIVSVKSERYKMDVTDLNHLEPVEAETGRSASLLRGVCDGFVKRGYKVGGFNASTSSEVLSGSGMSSSAAHEVLLGTIINHLFNDGKISPVEIAQIAQYAENNHFGKPCGLMDQTASAVGGFVKIDFKDPKHPVIDKIDFDLSEFGHALCIVDAGGNHSDLTDEYTAVRREMEQVAGIFDKSVLRELEQDVVFKNIKNIRETSGNDRAVLRALHFYNDNSRVDIEAAALENGDFEGFKRNVIESGRSSYMYNQNVFCGKEPFDQSVSVALMVSEMILKDKGAWRVHGGGFAGTIQAFVPFDLLDDYIENMSAIFGEKCCYVLRIRNSGGVSLL